MARKEVPERTSREDNLLDEQVRLLTQNAPLSYGFTLLNGFVLAFAQRAHIPTGIVVGWLLTLVLVMSARGALLFRYRQEDRGDHCDATFWLRTHLLGAGLSGVVWGSSSLLLFPEGSSPHQLFVAFMLAGMTAGAASVLAARLEVAFAFMVPALLPLVFQFAHQDGELATVMSAMTAIFLVGMGAVTVNLHRSMTRSLRLHLDKQSLLRHLSAEKVETDALNDRLLTEVEVRKGAEAALREARDSLEVRVRQRTADLEREVAERRNYAAKLQHLAHHDSLTGLGTRALLSDRLHHAVQRARRQKGRVAVLFVDLDRFKMINDSLGHAAGDTLLKLVAGRLLDCVREGDTVTRLGGDEFVVVVEDATSAEDAEVVTRKILDALQQPFQIDDQEFVVTGSVGVSMYPDHGEDGETLLKNANIALHRAKSLGRNDSRIYAAELSSGTGDLLALERDLRGAIANDEMLLHYQPVVRLADGKVVGFESLLRWRSNRWGMMAPSEFIPMAEESGEIVAMGAWALKAACAEARSWQEPSGTHPRVAVNLSPRQFMEAGLTDLVARTLADSGLEPGRLELEITESQLMSDVPSAIETVENLKRLGVKIAIDDFGTGYSSLNYLKRFPVDRLKIDRTFIHDVASNPEDAAITRAIVSLAHSMNMTVVAEGVETEEQASFLREIACDEVQGFLLGHPLDAAKIPSYFRTSSVSRAARRTE